MQNLTVRQLVSYLGISKERVWRMIHIERIRATKHYQGKGFIYHINIQEAGRIKAILEDPSYTYPTNCVVCGKLFERTYRRIFVCPKCLSIEKECECGCGALISKYSYKKTRDGKPIIKRYERGHVFKAWHQRVKQDPKLYQEVCEIRRKQWQDPEFQEKARQGRANTSHIHLAKIREGRRTDIEQLVDAELHRLGIAFEPDYRIGSYWIDCAILSHRIAVEVDGTYFHSLPNVQRINKRKDAWLLKSGWKVIRIKGNEIREDVQKAIAEKVLPLLN